MTLNLLATAILLVSIQASSPSYSPEFKPELARLSSTGLEMKEFQQMSLDGGAIALAVVLERAKPADPREAYEFRILEADGGKVSTIFRRTEFFFTMEGSPEISALNGTDLNKNGNKEVIVQSSSGGNCWDCNPTEIYAVENHKATLIAAGPIRKIEDLDGDSRPELLLTDARWEIYEGLPHAAAPWSTIVYAWHNGRYEVASSDFMKFYQGELDRLRITINEARSMITAEAASDDVYVGLALAIAITYADCGQPDRGVVDLKSLLQQDSRSSEQSKRRSSILADFTSGSSAKKLRAIKPGDPLL